MEFTGRTPSLRSEVFKHALPRQGGEREDTGRSPSP